MICVWVVSSSPVTILKFINSYLEFLLQSDVNTVCFTDESGHTICSGSDDGLCKVKIIHLQHKIYLMLGVCNYFSAYLCIE